ncbi:MAG: hypothetical protein J5529_01990 [Prevotella sp.]|nr:hypothetical protein [Prevotella sp.]
MKKIFVMAAAAIMAVTSVQAQDEPKQEIAISYGVGSNSDIIDAFEDFGTAMVGASFDNESYFGPISLEYFYHVKPWLGVGAIAVYGQMSQDLYLSGKKNGKDGKIKNNYVTLMPAVKFDWLRKDHFGMYSKLAFGATLRNEKVDYDSNIHEDFDDSEVHINWQATLLGLEAGGQQLRGFFEIGTGEQGIFLLGLRYKF